MNAFGYENKVFPLFVSKKTKLTSSKCGNEEKSHYVFIKDFNWLMYSRTKYKDRKQFCM